MGRALFQDEPRWRRAKAALELKRGHSGSAVSISGLVVLFGEQDGRRPDSRRPCVFTMHISLSFHNSPAERGLLPFFKTEV